MNAVAAFDDHFGEWIGIEAAVELLGLPAVQIIRWCGDGTIPDDAYRGNPLLPGKMRFSRAWIVDRAKAPNPRQGHW